MSLLYHKRPDLSRFCRLYNTAFPKVRNLLLFSPGKERNTKRPILENLDSLRLSAFVGIIPYGHTYATMLYDAGVDIKSAQRFMGHADLETTLKIYTHLSDRKEEQAISALNAHFSGRMNPDAVKMQ